MAQSPHQREGWLSVNSPWHWDTACVRPAFPSLCQRKRIKLSRKTTSKTMWFWQVKGVFLLLGRPSLSSDKLEHQSCSPWGVSHWAGVWCCLLPLLPSIPSCSASAAWGGAADQIRKFLKYSMVWKIEGGKKDYLSDDDGGGDLGCETAMPSDLPQNIVEIQNISLEMWKVLQE